MADDSPNKARIQAMLDDLAENRQGSDDAPSGMPPGGVPGNLPTTGAAPSKPAPPPAPKPVPPPAPKPEPQQSPEKTAVQAPPKPSAPPPAPTVPATPKAPQGAPKPPTPKPEQPSTASPTTSEVRTMSADVERLSTGQAPAPVPQQPPASPEKEGATAPQAPPTPAPRQTQQPAGISVPEPTGGGMGRKLVYAGIGIIILLVVIFAAVSLLGGDAPESTPAPTPTPSPTASPSPTPTAKDLSFYFGQLGGTLRVPDDQTVSRTDFQNRLREFDLRAGQAVNVEAMGMGPFPASLNTAPSDMFGTTGAVLIFGQTESFGANGESRPLTVPEPRLIYVFEVTDATAVNQFMQEWEQGSMENELSYYFNFTSEVALVTGFSDATYRQIPIRYRNFPYADRSIDWAIVPASNDRNYLVLSGSRESMFFAINQLLK